MTTMSLAVVRGREQAKRRTRALADWGTWIACAVLIFVLTMVLVPNLIAPYDPLEADPSVSMQGPTGEHIFGTDRLGRDVFSRIVHGASASMPAALTATAVALVLGTLLGTIAATLGRWVDAVIMRLFDAVLAVPGLLLIFAFLAALGNSVMTIAVAIGISGCVSFGRLMRAEVMRIRNFTYVEAARASGARPFAIILRHIAPNAIRPLIALAALDIGTALLTIGAMGYLGFGLQPPAPEWGAMIADGQQYLSTAPWLSFVPGLTFVVVVLASNQLSRRFERERTR